MFDAQQVQQGDERDGYQQNSAADVSSDQDGATAQPVYPHTRR